MESFDDIHFSKQGGKYFCLSGFDGFDAGIGTVENSCWYWYGKVEALQVTPSLSDSNTATVTLTLQSNLFGAYTVDV